ncbi:MAG: hypothetical protein ACI9JN_001826 [Bacteroidia bacterium]|jgi:hypothetical protein
MGMENFVILETYFNSIDAHNAKNHLDTCGIFSQIIGDINATSYNFFTQSNGGIRLYVHKDDFENAQKLLNISV